MHQNIVLTLYGNGVGMYPTQNSEKYESRWTIVLPKKSLHKLQWESNLSPYGKTETAVTDKRHPGRSSDGFLFYVLPSGSSIPFNDGNLIKNLIRRSDEYASKNSSPTTRWMVIAFIIISVIAVVIKIKNQKHEINK